MALPTSPTTIKVILPSYIYEQYQDDQDLQAFATAFNGETQTYLDWFNAIDLPIYTAPGVTGPLLDWVGTNLWGVDRPSLPFGTERIYGPFNTGPFNTLEFNEIDIGIAIQGIGIGEFVIGVSPIGGYSSSEATSYVTSDDTYRRVITWAVSKAYGKIFNIRTLKRRVMQFLFGTDGINFNVDQTYRVSVTFGTENNVTIRILSGETVITGGAEFNSFEFNELPFDALSLEFTPLPPIAMAPIFKAAVDSGVLELPFAFEWTVDI